MPVLEQVLETFPKEVKLVFKNFPIPSHRFAREAAAAALAAGRSGKFWEYHNKLFEAYNRIDSSLLLEIARSIGIDEKTFSARLRDPEIQARIEKDIEDAREAGVRGTPTIFVNGRQLRDRSFNGFRAAVARARARARAKP